MCDETGKVILKFGIATGFRNIQTIVRKLKSKALAASLPHYIEIMACPTGVSVNLKNVKNTLFVFTEEFQLQVV